MSSDTGARPHSRSDPREMVDWGLAVTVGQRLAKTGPRLGPGETARAVASLHDAADQAEMHVESYTRLTPTERVPVMVMDRAEWLEANVRGLEITLGPLLDRFGERDRGRVATSVGRRATAVQVGGLLSWLSTRVLGQYEIFLPRTVGVGRLDLVLTNLVAAERALDVDSADFRLWVALHEQAHRTQFTAVPWMRDHLESLVAEMAALTDLDPAVVAERLKGLLSAARGKGSLAEAFVTPEQRAVMDRVQALMTLLEGHAEHVMDAVGPTVVPSVELIRKRFEDRRASGNALERAVRRLLGFDAKLAQYKTGKAFVDEAVGLVGIEAFNTVWTSPETLPRKAELDDAALWVARCL